MPSINFVSWRTPSSRLAWATPLSADLIPPFRPLRILYDPNRIGVRVFPPLSPCLPVLVAFPLLQKIPYQQQPFIPPPYWCPLPPPDSPVPSCPLQPSLPAVPSLSPSPTPTPAPLTSSWSILQRPHTRASSSLKRLPWLIPIVTSALLFNTPPVILLP